MLALLLKDVIKHNRIASTLIIFIFAVVVAVSAWGGSVFIL